MDEQEKLHFPKIYDYFIANHHILKILPIINREKKKIGVSLSLLDWFVTNYCKNKEVLYTNNRKPFSVYLEYKDQLKTCKGKRYFDPFNRSGDLIQLHYKEQTVYTTFKQLHFLYWASKNKVIKYIEDNFEEIDKNYHRFKTEKKSAVVKEPVVVAKKATFTVKDKKRFVFRH